MMNPLKYLAQYLVKESVNQLKPIFATFNTFRGQTYASRDYYYGLVFSCVDAIATNVANNPFSLYQKLKDDEKEVTHPALDLLNTPNEFQTGVDLLYLISSHIDTSGKAYLYPVPNLGNTEPVRLFALDPTRMVVVPGENMIAGYIFINPKGVRIPFSIEEIIPIMRPNPYDQTNGISTIEMARRTIEADLNSQDFNNQFFQNGANPSGILTTDGGLSEEVFNRLKEQWHEKYEGKENAHKTMILEGGLKYQQVAISQRDMDYVKQRQFTRDEILSIFKVPKTIVAITDDVNRANAETSEYTFAKRVVDPRLGLIFEKLNRFYLPKFKDNKNLELRYENPVPDDKAMNLLYDQAAVNKWETVNEIRLRNGLDPLPDEALDTIPSTDPLAGIMQGASIEDLKKKDFSPKIKSAYDNQYIQKKKSLKQKQQVRFSLKLKQAIKIQVDKIEKKDFSFMKTKGTEDSFLEIMPPRTEFKGIVADIAFDHELDALKSAIKLTGDHYNLPVDFSLEHSGAISILRHRVDTVADDATNALYEKARKIIADKLAEEETDLQAIKESILSTFKDEAEYRAERIARTEMNFAFNEGAMQDMASSGLVHYVKWILGDAPCEVCEENENEVVKIGEDFHNGFSQPPVHPNCECDVVPDWSKGEEPVLDLANPKDAHNVFDWTGYEGTKKELAERVQSRYDHEFPDLAGFTKEFDWKVEKYNISDLQVQCAVDPDKVTQYLADMKKGDKFPPIMSVKLGAENPLVVDGAHRIEALRQRGAETIEVITGRPK